MLALAGDMDKESVKGKTGIYERAVQHVTEWTKPYLHGVTERFVKKSVDKYAKDNPRFARMIEFEIRRRGDGAGLTQDVAEPLIWTGIKTVPVLAVAVLTESIKSKSIKMVGYGAALGLVLNNAVELFRLVPRYTAGLQGSLEMAKDRWRSIEETGVDPFNQQSREINKGKPKSARRSTQEKSPVTSARTQNGVIETRGITPKASIPSISLKERAERDANLEKSL